MEGQEEAQPRGKNRETEADTGEELQRIQLRTTAMQSLTEEALHSQLLMVRFLHTKKPIKHRLVLRRSTLSLSLSMFRSLSHPELLQRDFRE